MAKISAQELTKKFFSQILDQIGLSAKVVIEEKDNIIKASVDGENLGALIGYHGETLGSLQLLLSLMVNKTLKEEDWQRIVVDIGNWREERSSTLREMVERSVEQLEEVDQEKVGLPAMSSSERREIHVIISDQFPDYESISEGEEPDRRVFLKKKTNS